jgi:hypothetical protein
MRHFGADKLSPAGAAPLRISQRPVPRFPNDPVQKIYAPLSECLLGVVSGHSSMPDPALATHKITTMSQ